MEAQTLTTQTFPTQTQTFATEDRANDTQIASSEAQIAGWVETFHRDGFLLLHDVLSPEQIATLKDDLDRALHDNGEDGDGTIQLHARMFEVSPANLGLFEQEPIVTFAETLIGTHTHVVHNNSFRVQPGKGITTWHQDDPPHYLVTHGDPPMCVCPSCCLRPTTTSPT